MTARTRRERGSAALELVGLVPAVIVVAMLVLQVGFAIWATTVTNSASRDGARALAMHRDGCAAARGAMSGSLQVTSCQAGVDADAATVTVQTRIPRVVALLPEMTVTRTAVMPTER